MAINNLFSDSLPQTGTAIPYLSDDDSEIYLFHIGIPSPETFPREIIKEELSRADFPWDEGLQYSPVVGDLSGREGICALYDYRGEEAHPEEIMITAGIAEAFDLLPQLFINPGDVIYTEDPSYPWGIRSFKIHRAEIKAIPTGDKGMDLNVLESAIKKDRKRAKLIYTMPVYHNPLGILVPDEQRQDMLALAQKYNLMIVEDDPYRELAFDGRAPTSKRLEDPESVINLGTFSKTIGGGVRLGWIWAHRDIINRLQQIKHTGTTTLMARAVGNVLKEEKFYHHIENCRLFYKNQKQICRQALSENGLEKMISTDSQGGFYYWLKLPGEIKTDDFYNETFNQGIYLLSGSFFGESAELSRYFRLSFSFESADKLRSGIEKIAEILRSR